MKRAILTATILLAAAGCASQTDSAGLTEKPAEAAPSPSAAKAGHAAVAATSMKTLAHLVSPGRLLGFHSTTEVASASLADPLPVFMVGLNDLRAYQAGNDPRPLLHDERAVLYPVTVGGDVRSSILVRNVDGDWKPSQYGRANLAKFAHEGRARVAGARGVPESAVSLVEIPTMSTQMLRHDENGAPMLTALLDVPGTDVRAGMTLPAGEVFAKLQPLAAHNDGKTPN